MDRDEDSSYWRRNPEKRHGRPDMAQPIVERRTSSDRPPRMTYEKFLAWVPDGKQAEWVNGEVFILTTSTRHARLSRLLVNLLSSFVALFDLGEVFPAPFLMRATPGGPGREPDILVLLKNQLGRVKHLGIEGPADLVVEFVSAESVTTDRVRKYREYEAAGIREYLVIDAREGHHEFAHHRLDAHGRYAPVAPDAAGRYHSAVLPGLRLDPRWFAQDLLPAAEYLLLEIAPDAYVDWIAAMRRARDESASGG